MIDKEESNEQATTLQQVVNSIFYCYTAQEQEALVKICGDLKQEEEYIYIYI